MLTPRILSINWVMILLFFMSATNFLCAMFLVTFSAGLFQCFAGTIFCDSGYYNAYHIDKTYGNFGAFIVEISVTILRFFFINSLEISVVLKKTRRHFLGKGRRMTRLFLTPTSLVTDQSICPET